LVCFFIQYIQCHVYLISVCFISFQKISPECIKQYRFRYNIQDREMKKQLLLNKQNLHNKKYRFSCPKTMKTIDVCGTMFKHIYGLSNYGVSEIQNLRDKV
jgi:hypothetical protein